MNEVGGGKKIKLQTKKLTITLLNSDEKVKDTEENPEVIENYYRVKVAEI